MKEIDRHQNPNAPIDMLERHKMILDIDVNELSKVMSLPFRDADMLKRELIARSFSDCVDIGMGVEVGLLMQNYYGKP